MFFIITHFPLICLLENCQPLHLAPNLKCPKFNHFWNQIWYQYSLDKQFKGPSNNILIRILFRTFTNTARDPSTSSDQGNWKKFTITYFSFIAPSRVCFCLVSLIPTTPHTQCRCCLLNYHWWICKFAIKWKPGSWASRRGASKGVATLHIPLLLVHLSALSYSILCL